MSDLTERLRDAADWLEERDEAHDLLTEAADEIERLRYELERCQAADTRPDWGPETNLGAKDRDPNTRG